MGSIREDYAGFKVGNQLRVTVIMDRYENFWMKEGETLDEAYDRFVVLKMKKKIFTEQNLIRTLSL